MQSYNLAILEITLLWRSVNDFPTSWVLSCSGLINLASSGLIIPIILHLLVMIPIEGLQKRRDCSVTSRYFLWNSSNYGQAESGCSSLSACAVDKKRRRRGANEERLFSSFGPVQDSGLESLSHSLLVSLSWNLDLSKLVHGFLQFNTWISLSWYMDLSTLIQGFV